jgi:predicted RND superfamily exporter protein
MSKAINDPGDPYYDSIPDSRAAVAQYLELYSMSGDPEDFERVVNFDYTETVMTLQLTDGSNKAVKKVVEKLDRLTENDAAKSIIGGYSLVEADIAFAIVKGQANSFILAISVIALLLMIIFRSLKSGLVGSISLILAVILLFGTMGWFGLKLDIATAMLTSIAIGVGVDYTIHFLWRYKYERAKGKDGWESIIQTLTTTGRGITINAISVMIGFSTLFISAFSILKYFAFLIIFTILICLISSLVVVPAICLVFKPRFLEPENKSKL